MAKPIKISVGCGVGTALHHKLTNQRAEKKNTGEHAAKWREKGVENKSEVNWVNDWIIC